MKLIQIKENILREPEEWQTAYYDYLYNFASYRVDDKELIKDLIQDTFLAAIQGRASFRNKSSEITWLTAILKYKIYKNYKSKGKNILVYISSLNLKDMGIYTTEDDEKLIEFFSDPLDLKNFEREIKQFIGTLPEKWQILYDLKYLSNESTGVICEKLKLSESNFWVISHRLKVSLRTWYMTKWN